MIGLADTKTVARFSNLKKKITDSHGTLASILSIEVTAERKFALQKYRETRSIAPNFLENRDFQQGQEGSPV